MDTAQLNNEQREAVMHTEGPLLVLAGAGSGKTRVLTQRIAYLIEHNGVHPQHILALTFTNKAAGEMRERVEALLGIPASGMWVMTFHSFCARILRMEIEHLGYEKSFVIYDDADQQSLLKKIIKEMGLNDKVFTARSLSGQISDAKNHSDKPLAYLREARAPREIIGAFERYEKHLKRSNAVDFDDLLLLTLRLFREFPDTLEKYRARFRYILVDEYQDTNMIQYHIVSLLAQEHRNLCVVGDDDQSIYGWRGADIRNILEFERDFPGCKVVRLEQNYRSTSAILEAANLVISNNRARKPKRLWTERVTESGIFAFEAVDEREEANHICNGILSGARYGERRYDDYAILYRTHAQSRILEMYLKSYDIPYRVYGGTSFFQRAEVKDILAYLRLLYNPNDDVAFLRVINLPRRGIGDTTVAALQRYAGERGLSLLPAAYMMQADTDMAALYKKFAAFCDTIRTVYAEIGNRPLHEATALLLDAIAYDAYLREDRKENYEARADVVKEFIGYIAEFSMAMDEHETNVLQAFLENVALFAAADSVDEQSGSVSLMTLHSAKGLEFPVVYLCGLEDGLFPSSQSLYETDKLEEERRLCYVGITRAREELHLTHARQRMLYGKIGASMPSRFLKELEPALPASARPSERYMPRRSQSFATSASVHALTEPISGKKAVPRIEVRTARQDADPLPPGQRVRHKSFGDGTVVSFGGSGGGQIIEIAFDSGEIKKFAAAYAPIETI